MFTTTQPHSEYTDLQADSCIWLAEHTADFVGFNMRWPNFLPEMIKPLTQ